MSYGDLKTRRIQRAAPSLFAFGFRALDDVDGGIETHARELYPRLARLGLEITVLARATYKSAGTQDARSNRADVRVRWLYAPRRRSLEAIVHSAVAAGYCILKRPAIVHVHGIGPALFIPLLRLFGLRVVMTHHGHDYDATKWGRAARAILKTGEWAGVRSASDVICVSNAISAAVWRLYGVESHPIYNGIPRLYDVVTPDDPAIAAFAPGKFVLMVGRITAHKRVEDVIDAVAALKDAGLSLVVCGSGSGSDPYSRAVAARAEKAGNVTLAGYVPPRHLPWLYSNALCTVMASSYEGMPLAVIEALASGSRVLLSRIPAHEELKVDESRYFAIGDTVTIREKICGDLFRHKYAIEDAESRPKLDARFSWDKISEATYRVLLGRFDPSIVDHRRDAAV